MVFYFLSKLVIVIICLFYVVSNANDLTFESEGSSSATFLSVFLLIAYLAERILMEFVIFPNKGFLKKLQSNVVSEAMCRHLQSEWKNALIFLGMIIFFLVILTYPEISKKITEGHRLYS